MKKTLLALALLLVVLSMCSQLKPPATFSCGQIGIGAFECVQKPTTFDKIMARITNSNPESYDYLMERRADLARQYTQQTAAGMKDDSARITWLLSEIDKVDASIIEMNKAIIKVNTLPKYK